VWPVIGCGDFYSCCVLFSPAPALALLTLWAGAHSGFLSLQVLRNRGVYENVKYVQQENFWIGPSSVSAVGQDCWWADGGLRAAAMPPQGPEPSAAWSLVLAAAIGWTSTGPYRHWQGAEVLPAPATLQNGLPAGWGGPWHSSFAPCSCEAKHGARENAGVVWCVTAFLMPFRLGRAVVSQGLLSQPQCWPFWGHGQRNP